jgi:drug/metabolite transporter (DMT)-like permease
MGAFFGMMMLWGPIGCLVMWLHPPAGAGRGRAVGHAGLGDACGVFQVIIVVQGIRSLLGVTLAIRRYHIASATLVAVFENTLLVFATLWPDVLWRQVPDPVESVASPSSLQRGS